MPNTTLREQQTRIAQAQPELLLHAPCKLGEGIVAIADEEAKRLRDLFHQSDLSKAYFIPASGSGSRMFEFLFDFLSAPTEENRGQVERFLNHIEDFAFFYQFPPEVQHQLSERTMEIDAFVAYILNDNGMGLAHLPKGLIPFHKHGPFLLNPFHEHVLQGLAVANQTCNFHFTIRSAFQQLINKRLQDLEGMTGKKPMISFSEQNPDTDAFAFTKEGELAFCENGEPLRRPAGHGALLSNLNALESDAIFIKNIDNVQHWNHSEEAIGTQQLLGGLLLAVQTEINAIIANPSFEAIQQLNDTYELYHEDDLNQSLDQIVELLKRPIRVCGMVRNEGLPGGGPFWVHEKGRISKQIVEKAQINTRADQYRLMIQSTHFNPVMMVCSGKLHDGSKVDFMQYSDPDNYFIVNKKYRGKEICFTELPGLWNGSMAHWNSLFVEIPSTTFSPVKTILDLLEASHQK
ncbi:MAG: DUF4301 family protein [Bacteroidota bacterium]